jgi:hypothetical protein
MRLGITIVRLTARQSTTSSRDRRSAIITMKISGAMVRCMGHLIAGIIQYRTTRNVRVKQAKRIGLTLSQLLRSGRGEADPVPESGAATAPNRKSLKWNRRRRRPHHRAASSRCAAQAPRAGRADSAPPKASFAAPDSSAPTRQGIKSASAPAPQPAVAIGSWRS